MKKTVCFVIGLIIILAIAINYDHFAENTKMKYRESNADLNKSVIEILSKVGQAQDGIKYFNSELDIIINDKDSNIENIKVKALKDVDKSISFIRLKDLNLNTVPIEVYHINNTLYKYNYEDNEWIVKNNVNNVSIEYKDLNISIGFDISEIMDTDSKNLRINGDLSNEKYIVLEDEDKVNQVLDEIYLVSNMKGTIWIERETYYINRILLENHLFDEESTTLLQEFIMDMNIKEINNQFEIKLPRELQ